MKKRIAKPAFIVTIGGMLVVLLSGARLAGAAGPAQTELSWASRIRTAHPRLYFTDQTWPLVRKRALSECAEDYARVKMAASTRRGDDWLKIKRPGPLPGSGIEVYDWGARVFAQAFVHRMEPAPELLEDIKQRLRASIAYYHAAYDQNKAAAWYSLSRAGCFTALDWLWNDLTPEERKEIGGGLLAHVEETLHKPGIIYRNDGGITDGNYGVRNVAWFAGLALYKEGINDKVAEEALRAGYETYQSMFEHRAAGAGDDGGGASATLGYLIGEYPNADWNFLHTFRSALGEDLAGRQPWSYGALLPVYIFWNWLPGDHEFGYGDTPHLTNRIPTGSLYGHMSQIIHFFSASHPDLAAVAGAIRDRTGGRPGSSWFIHRFLEAEPNLPPAPLQVRSQPLARHFEAMGQTFFRSGDGAENVYALFACGGRIGQHRHLDAGHFTIYHNGFLALDSGTREGNTDNLQNYFAQTEAHNCVLIKMPGEPPVPYWNGEVYGNGGGQNQALGSRVVAFETGPDFAYAAGDATPVYRPEKCALAVRQFVFLPPRHFVVFDRVTATKAEYRKRWLLHHANKPELLEERTWRADQGNGRLFCRTFLPRDASLEMVGGPGKEFLADGVNYPIDAGPSGERLRLEFPVEKRTYAEVPELMGRWRVEVRPGADRREDLFLHLLEVADLAQTEMIPSWVREEGDAVELSFTAGAREVRLRFASRGPVGGAIRINRGARVLVDCPLADSVMPQAGF
jgi:heparin/heparan-sulfate lyase